MVGPSSHNCPIVNIRRKGMEAPGFSEAKEWENVERGQDGGQRGTLGCAMVQDNFREGVTFLGTWPYFFFYFPPFFLFF